MVNAAAGVSWLTTSFIVPAPPAVPRSARDQPGPPVPITEPAKFGCFLGQWPIAGKSPRPGRGAITQGDASMIATAVAGGRLVLDPHGACLSPSTLMRRCHRPPPRCVQISCSAPITAPSSRVSSPHLTADLACYPIGGLATLGDLLVDGHPGISRAELPGTGGLRGVREGAGCRCVSR
jgi:hypothetical protein